MIGGWSGSRSPEGEALELLDAVLDAPGSPFWELENAIHDSELSDNLARELLPLPGPAVTFVPLDTYPLLRVRGAGWPHCGSLQQRKRSLPLLRTLDGTFRRGFVFGSPFPSPRILPSRLVGIYLPLSVVVQLECGPRFYTSQAGLPQTGVMLAKLWRVARLS